VSVDVDDDGDPRRTYVWRQIVFRNRDIIAVAVNDQDNAHSNVNVFRLITVFS
jgi:hypothetical protein